RDGEGSLEHGPVTTRAAPALHDRALARLEDEGRGTAAGGAARDAGRGDRRLAHGSILVRRRDRAAAVLVARPASRAPKCGIREVAKEASRDSPLRPGGPGLLATVQHGWPDIARRLQGQVG